MNVINLLIGILVIVLIAYVVFWVLGQIPMPQPVRAVVTGIIAIILLLFVLNWAGALAIF